MNWLNRFSSLSPDQTQSLSPSALAEHELRTTLQDQHCETILCPAMGDGFSWTLSSDRIWMLKGGETGLLYGAYALIRHLLSGETPPSCFESAPRYAYRMINCWDNMDGTVERGYAGRSLFFEAGRFAYDPSRIIHLGRMMASVGLNILCLNNVNVHEPAQGLLKERLSELAVFAGLLRPFGVRLMLSVDFSMPLREKLPTADPLDPLVQSWWNKAAERVYQAIPDFAGFLVKADSEGRPGPFSYGRSHADGANMLARALKPFDGILVWRCFVYNCRQDWRDTSVDRVKAAFDTYQPLDGQFDSNVILQIKNGPWDFQVREPVSPLLLSLQYTSVGLELQLAQEYTGQQIDIYAMPPMWDELFRDLSPDRIHAVSAVSNLGRDENYFGHPLAAVNFFCFGLLAWNPKVSPDAMIDQWIRLTYDFREDHISVLKSLLLSSRRIYEKYTAPLGLGWMITPHSHYGPNPSGYEYDVWGTYHRANRNAVGVDRTAAGTGFLNQLPEKFRTLYSSPAACPDLLLLFFHRLSYLHVMPDGRTLIQRIYDDHFEGAEEAAKMADTLYSLPFPSPDREIIADRAARQTANAENWRDTINTFFYRLSGIPDQNGRKIFD